MNGAPGAVLTWSVDYSVDELDALADAFGVPALGGARLSAGPADAVLRATLATALRGLVARRAIALGGSATSPRIELLEPHGTVLGTYLGASRIVRVDLVHRTGVERWVTFLRDAVAVEQRALPRQPAILRMTAHAGERFRDLALGPLAQAADDGRAGRGPLTLSARQLDQTSDELRAAGAPEQVIDLAHARRRRVDIVQSEVQGRRITRRTDAWLDAGELGWWRVVPEGGEPAPVAQIIPCALDDLLGSLRPEGSLAR